MSEQRQIAEPLRVCGTIGNVIIENDFSTADQPKVKIGIVAKASGAEPIVLREKKQLAPNELELLRGEYLLGVTLEIVNLSDVMRCSCFSHECHHRGVSHSTVFHELAERFSIDSVMENGEYRDAYFNSEFGKAYSNDRQDATVTFVQVHRKPHFKTDMLMLLK